MSKYPEYEKIGSRLSHLAEECSELIKAIMKADRFGIDNHHPDTPVITNMHEILHECDDVEKRIKEVRMMLNGRT